MSNSLRIGSSESTRSSSAGSFIETPRPVRARGHRLAGPGRGGPRSGSRPCPSGTRPPGRRPPTAVKVQTLGGVETDPLLAEAITLQGYEEGRHAEVIQPADDATTGSRSTPSRAPQEPSDPTWAFLRTGYGECLDSFFAFGLFEIGKRSEFFPDGIIVGLRHDHAGGGAPHPLHRQLGGVPARAASRCRCVRRSTRAAPGTSSRRPSTA